MQKPDFVKTIRRESPVKPTARTLQLSGMFDLPPDKKSEVSWDVDLSELAEKPWQVGLIVGPSGAGKTTLARELFGGDIVDQLEWPRDASVVDAFPKGMSIKEITGWLTSVGFGSAPAWLRPFHALSNGEQFRVTLARALAETQHQVVIDEFTSVVDRQVAKVASHAVAKAVRRTQKRLIAVTCHYDVIDWLQPDWVYQPHAGDLTWRCLRRRPSLELEIYPISRADWRYFEPHHYLSRNIHRNAVCFGGFVGGECVAFTSYLHFPHSKTRNIKMGHRLVVLPDWQGLGLGGRMDDWLGSYLYERGYRYHNVVAHPAMVAYYNRSPRWQHMRTGRLGSGGSKGKPNLKKHHTTFSTRRISSSFVYVPPIGAA